MKDATFYKDRRHALGITPAWINKKSCWHIPGVDVGSCALLFLLYVVEAKRIKLEGLL